MLSKVLVAALPTGKTSSTAWVPVESRVPDPGRFDGTPGRLPEFLRQCRQVFPACPNMAATRKVMYIVGRLRGLVLEWARAGNSRRPLTSCCLEEFLREFETVFDLPLVQVDTTPYWSSRKQHEERAPPKLRKPWASRTAASAAPSPPPLVISSLWLRGADADGAPSLSQAALPGALSPFQADHYQRRLRQVQSKKGLMPLQHHQPRLRQVQSKDALVRLKCQQSQLRLHQSAEEEASPIASKEKQVLTQATPVALSCS